MTPNDPGEDGTCKVCHDAYSLRPECDDTGYCDICAQTLVSESENDVKRMDWLQGRLRTQSLTVGFTHYYLTSNSGRFYLGSRPTKDKPETLRDLIDAIMEEKEKKEKTP